MYDDLHRGVHRLHGIIAAEHELCERHRAAFVGLADGVEHAALRLVAHLHPFRHHASRLDGRQHVVGVVVDVLCQRLHAVVGPRRGDGLAAWVGPCVAVVEVDHHAHALCLCAPAHRHHLLLTAGTAVHRPHAQADVVDALLLQNLQNVLLLPVLVEPLCAPAFHLWHKAHVGTEGKVLMFRAVEKRVGYRDGLGSYRRPSHQQDY